MLKDATVTEVPNPAGGVLRITDGERIRIICWDRPATLNSLNAEALDATVDALVDAAVDPTIAVVVITGTGRAFTAGGDLKESKVEELDWQKLGLGGLGNSGAKLHGVRGVIDQVANYPKPLLLAVNGLATGLGGFILGLADMVFMSSDARVRTPFARLGVGPEGAASYLLPQAVGKQHAMWMFLGAEWIAATECERNGLAFRVCEPEQLMDVTLEYARTIAQHSIAVLVEAKALVTAAYAEELVRAREREDLSVRRLMGGPASVEAFAAIRERRDPDFASVDELHPPVTTVAVPDRVSHLSPGKWAAYRQRLGLGEPQNSSPRPISDSEERPSPA